MACTVNDIAKAAGVSRTTVLRALSGKPDVGVETKERILKLAAEMRYRPNYIARSLTRGRSGLVGIVATPHLYHVFDSTIEVLENRLREAGYSVLLYIARSDSASDEPLVEQLLNNQAEGVIAVPSSAPETGRAYKELIDAGVNLVVIDGYVEGLKAPQVMVDNYRAAQLATEHLISLGHRRIVYLAIPQASYVGRERARGFRDAMSSAGIPVPESAIVETEFDEKSAGETAVQLVSGSNPPTAILVRHDAVARGVMRGLLAAGFSIPDDVSIVGSGDMPDSDVLRVPLTTVRFPALKMASLGIKTLLDMLEGKKVEPKTTVLDVELVVRNSTAPPRNDIA